MRTISLSDDSSGHELGFAEFVERSQRRRLVSLLEMGVKQRAKVRKMLDHEIRLESSASEHLTGPQESPRQILERLRFEGAPATAYVMSANARIDQKLLLLPDAVEVVTSSRCGGVISCIPGRLAYYQAEGPSLAYLLKKALPGTAKPIR
jgi:hypothetical protein